MPEKHGLVKNPLTIIAAFAGIAEVFGTAVLPFIESKNQTTFIWFLMLFPSTLVLLFFATLNWNHKVLYAPSDFDNEDNFMSLMEKRKIETSAQIGQVVEKSASAQEETKHYEETKRTKPPSGATPLKAPATWKLAQNAAIKKLNKEFAGKIEHEVSYGASSNLYRFDAVIHSKKDTFFIETEFTNSMNDFIKKLSSKITKIAYALADDAETKPPKFSSDKKVIFCVVTPLSDEDKEIIEVGINAGFKAIGLEHILRFFHPEDLV